MLVSENSKRCLTPELIKIQQNAMTGIVCDLRKADVSNVAKRLCTMTGNRGILTDVLDNLYAVLPENDCQPGMRAIVWISNKRLAERLGVDVTTIQRALNSAAKLAIITFHDSPNGKRYYNQKTGEKFGIDLTPGWNNYRRLKQEVEELEALLRQKKCDQAEIKRLKKSVLANINRALERARNLQLTELIKKLQQLKQHAEKINQSAMNYAERIDALKILAGQMSEIWEKLAPKTKPVTALTRSSDGAHAVHQYNTSLTPFNKFADKSEFCCLAFESEKQNFKRCLKSKLDNNQVFKPDFPSCEVRVATFNHQIKSIKTARLIEDFAGFYPAESEIDFTLVCQALREVKVGYGFEWKTWRDVEDALPALKRGIGFSDDALEKSLRDYSPVHIALCLGVVLEKVLRDGDVREPGGYVRWLLRRSQADAQLLERILEPMLWRLMEPDNACH